MHLSRFVNLRSNLTECLLSFAVSMAISLHTGTLNMKMSKLMSGPLCLTLSVVIQINTSSASKEFVLLVQRQINLRITNLWCGMLSSKALSITLLRQPAISSGLFHKGSRSGAS